MSHELINQFSGETEYYTPFDIVEAVHKTLGEIDLDPASSKKANKRIGAKCIYTEKDNGLKYNWYGRIFLNHPFGIAENICNPKLTGKVCNKKICSKRGWHANEEMGNKIWIDKLIEEYILDNIKQFCNITFNASSEDWFQPLLQLPQCILHPRTNYELPNGKIKKGVTKGSVVTYGGKNVDKFYKAFKHLGTVKINYILK